MENKKVVRISSQPAKSSGQNIRVVATALAFR